MRGRINKWIFSSVFGLVISLPFLIPGCSPLSSGPQVPTQIAQIVQMANLQSSMTGQPVSLDDLWSLAYPDESASGLGQAQASVEQMNALAALVSGSGGGGEKFDFVRDDERDRLLARAGKTRCVIEITDQGLALARC